MYYFSGTGNTRSLVYHFSNYLRKLGFNTEIRRMDRDVFEKPTVDFTLGLMFPVAIQSTFPIVWDFVLNLPPGEGREVFMFDTMEAFSGGVVGPMKKVLSDKGYHCIGAREFRMSSSINTKVKKINKGIEKNRMALSHVEEYARDLVAGKTGWGRIPLISPMIKSLSDSEKIWQSNSEKLGITDRCVKCLICLKNCPVGALRFSASGISIDHKWCISCMRCAAKCPQKAIVFGGKVLQLSSF